MKADDTVTRLVEKIQRDLVAPGGMVRGEFLEKLESLLREAISKAYADGVKHGFKAIKEYRKSTTKIRLEAYTRAAEVARMFHHVDQNQICPLCRDLAAAIERLKEETK